MSISTIIFEKIVNKDIINKMIKWILLLCNIINAHSLKVGNRIFTKKQLINIELFLNSPEVKDHTKCKSIRDYIIDLETLKFLFKDKKIELHKELFQHILKKLPNPNSQEAKDFATYLTLLQQIYNSLNYDSDYTNKEHLEKAKNDIVIGFKVWKISNTTLTQAEEMKSQLESAPESDYKSIAQNATKFTEYKDFIMNFQFSIKHLNAIKRTIKGNFSDIVFEDGKYTFFRVLSSVIIDEQNYEELNVQKFKDEFVKNQIRLYKSCINVETQHDISK